MKVKCIKCLKEESCFTPGKVYKVKHGEITSDNGFTYRDSTNAKVLDFLSEWYLFKKVEKDKTVKMREKLRDYCQGRSCSGCKLSGDTCRCGNGTTFMMKGDTGNYAMSNKEIKAAFNIVFGTGIKEIKRHAKVGEYVKIVDEYGSCGRYKNGDILKIIEDTGHVRYECGDGEFLYDSEYVVLEGYNPEKQDKQDEPKEPYKFKVGDIVKGKPESYGKYTITTSDMTRGKIVCVSDDIITIEVLSHKTMPYHVGEKFVCKSKYFDLVEEYPKLYNGKIIFTKGDDTFKTGHIYEIKDGNIMLGDRKYPSRFNGGVFRSIEDVRKYFDKDTTYGWGEDTLEFIEVIDD